MAARTRSVVVDARPRQPKQRTAVRIADTAVAAVGSWAVVAAAGVAAVVVVAAVAVAVGVASTLHREERMGIDTCWMDTCKEDTVADLVVVVVAADGGRVAGARVAAVACTVRETVHTEDRNVPAVVVVEDSDNQTRVALVERHSLALTVPVTRVVPWIVSTLVLQVRRRYPTLVLLCH